MYPKALPPSMTEYLKESERERERESERARARATERAREREGERASERERETERRAYPDAHYYYTQLFPIPLPMTRGNPRSPKRPHILVCRHILVCLTSTY
jgi:hypothetical protein